MRKDVQPISAEYFEQSSPLDKLAKTVAKKHDVDGHSVVKHVVMLGDKTNDELLNRMGVEDPYKRISTIHALGRARRALNVWPEEE